MIDLDTLIENADLVALAERAGATLDKVPSGYRGACPLHGGDNKSAFAVYWSKPDGRWRWRCYTQCNTSGDALDFIKARYHVQDLPQAAQMLADETNQDLPGISEEEAKRIQRRRDEEKRRQTLRDLAATYYRDCFTNGAGAAARDYANRRGFTEDTVNRLGYSDGHLLKHLRHMGADLDLAAEVGILLEPNNGHDYYTDAIPGGYLVYLHEHHGVIEYMSGRAIETDDKAKKSRNMKAPKEPFWALQTRNGPLLILEGQACALTAWQWSHNALALCGTSLDKALLKEIGSYPGAYLILDDDVPVTDTRLQTMADILGPLVMIATLPPKVHDLNAWLQNGGTAADLAAVLEKARPWIDIAIDQAASAPPYQLEDHLQHLGKLVSTLPQATRGRYVVTICDRKKLAARSDFRRIVDEAAGEETDTNGYAVVEGRLSHYMDPMCNFAAFITHELIRDDGMNPPNVAFTINGALATGEPLEPIDIPAEDFDSMKWVSRHWGARPILYVAPSKSYELRRAIQEVSKTDLKRERVHTYTGWATIDGARCYLSGTGALGKEGLNADVRIDLGQSNLSRYELPAPPADLRPAIEASLDFLYIGPQSVTVPLWAAMYAAPLGPIKTLDAVLWVYGTTQSGKSTVTHLCLCHYGKDFIQGHKYYAPRDWTATVTDLEYSMFVTKDAPIVIDDYAPAASVSEARALGQKSTRVMRSVGNRSARGRSSADLTERTPRPPRGLVIATAESPVGVQSIVGRQIYIPVDRGDIIPLNGKGETTKLDEAQEAAQAGLYAQAMSGYIVWLTEHWQELEASLPEELDTLNRAARALFPSDQSRLTDYYAIMAAGIRLGLQYAADRGAISQSDVTVFSDIYRQCLIELLRSQSARVTAESPVVKFWEAIEALLLQKRAWFARRLDNNPIGPDRATLLGYYDAPTNNTPGVVYLLTTTALAEVKSYWQALDQSFDVQPDALRRQMRQQGYLYDGGQSSDSDHIERKTYISTTEGRTRTLWINQKSLQHMAGVAIGWDYHNDGDAEEPTATQ